MSELTDYVTYAEAHRHFSRDALWSLFDGDRGRLNITHECVDRHDPDRLAVRVSHAGGGIEKITFGALSRAASQVAHHLTGIGIRRGERVGIMLEPGLAFYALLFGTMKMGAVAVPLFTLFEAEGLDFRIGDCAPSHLFLAEDKAYLTDAVDINTSVITPSFFDDLGALPAEFAAKTQSDDMAMYQYTSGTSRDLPEAVKHRHQAVVTVCVAALYGTGVRPGDRFMCPSSPAWGHGLWHGTIAPLALGVEIAAYAGPFDPTRLFTTIKEMEITNLSAAATHFRMMKNAGLGSDGEVPLQKLSFTGEAMDVDTAEWCRRIFGHHVRSIYGSTEVGVLITGYPGASDFDPPPGSLGKPVPGVEVAVLDADDNPCPPGQVGEIKVRRHGEWFPIKDLGHVDENGFYFHDGRADDVIISAGWTLSPLDMENVLMKHPDVLEVAVVADPDAERGQVAKAHVVSRRAGDDAFVRELMEFAKCRLARHEYPRRVVFVDGLPKTPAGKINRRALRDAPASGGTHG